MKFSQSDTLFHRAAKVIPSVRMDIQLIHCSLPAHFPKFSKELDTNFGTLTVMNGLTLCGFGTVIHGYCEPSIENAVNESGILELFLISPIL